MRAVPRFADRRRKSATWPCPHPSTFSILVVFELHDIVLQLSGELDIASTVHLDKCVQVALDEHPRRLIVDASGLEFADVVGLGCLLRTCRKAERVNAEVVLASPNALLRRLIDAAGVANRFRIR
ncbi:MAG TPA: STAS domain-containing protein [Acidimicrobiia bacterium]|jgi:anti-anti-sigma factor